VIFKYRKLIFYWFYLFFLFFLFDQAALRALRDKEIASLFPQGARQGR
jgi:hypothetical protein